MVILIVTGPIAALKSTMAEAGMVVTFVFGIETPLIDVLVQYDKIGIIRDGYTARVDGYRFYEYVVK